jgi:hypothetical protein
MKASNKLVVNTIVSQFLAIKCNINVYHWRTLSYARHKASDELLSDISNNIDLFVETLIGITGVRPDRVPSFTMVDIIDDNAVVYLNDVIDYLEKLAIKDSSLASIRDDMLVNLNKTLYLMTLS